MSVVTVTQMNEYISAVVKGDINLKNVLIRGEISNYVHHSSGHRYFSLKDGKSAIKAIMFRYSADRLKFALENGMEVVAQGNITVYERDGVYQIQVTDIIPEGAGKESTALEQLKKKLSVEGIFAQEHKRSIPIMPQKIGVVTSPTGAVRHDIETTLEKRYPLCELYEVATKVQGEDAPQSICASIAKAENAGCDVIIVGRGGGSAEDLSAFNDETVARAIYNCKVPVISAVGHETDLTIADLAADVRAATPTAAAVFASRFPVDDIRNYIEDARMSMKNALVNIIDIKSKQLTILNARLEAHSPENQLKLMSEKVDSLSKRAETAVIHRIERTEAQLAEKIGRLESLSPLKVMARGYSLVYKGQNLVRNSMDLAEGDTLVIKFDKGIVEAEVKKIR